MQPHCNLLTAWLGVHTGEKNCFFSGIISRKKKEDMYTISFVTKVTASLIFYVPASPTDTSTGVEGGLSPMIL